MALSKAVSPTVQISRGQTVVNMSDRQTVFGFREPNVSQRTGTERAGFEPAMEFNPHTRLAGECLQPLGHLSWRSGQFRGCSARGEPWWLTARATTRAGPPKMRLGVGGGDGRGGIRTPEAGVARLLVFKTSAFNRSATLPSTAHGKASRSASRQREGSGIIQRLAHGRSRTSWSASSRERCSSRVRCPTRSPSARASTAPIISQRTCVA